MDATDYHIGQKVKVKVSVYQLAIGTIGEVSAIDNGNVWIVVNENTHKIEHLKWIEPA